jgi:hypothetical protein
MIGGNVTNQVEFVVISEKLAAMIHEGETLLLDAKKDEIREYEERKDVCRKAWEKYTNHVRQFLPEELQAYMKTLVSDDKVFSNILPPGEIGRYEYAVIEIPELAPIRATVKRATTNEIAVSYCVAGIADGFEDGEPYYAFDKYSISGEYELIQTLGVAKNIGKELSRRHAHWEDRQKKVDARLLEASIVPADEPAVISLINMDELVKLIRGVVKEDGI